MDYEAIFRNGYKGIQHMFSMLESFYALPENKNVSLRQAIDTLVYKMEPENAEMLVNMRSCAYYIHDSVNLRIALDTLKSRRKSEDL